MSWRLRVSVHPGIVDKTVEQDALFVKGWNNVELTVHELVQSIKSGRPYCAQLRGRRDTQHFQASDIASADVDEGPTIEEALQNPFVRDHASFLYTTCRHQPVAHRYRIVFVLPRTITSPGEMSAVLRAIQLRVNGDGKTVDAARMYFGNRNAEVFVLDREISPAMLEELIAQGMAKPEADTIGNGAEKSNLAPSRSRLVIQPKLEVRLAKGAIIPFSDILPRATVHCPFHNDRHASAFVVASRNGTLGIHCSACGSTYWPESVSAGDEVFESFERTVREAADYCQIAPNCDPHFAWNSDPFDVAKTGVAEPYIAEQSRSWRTAGGEREVMLGS